MLKKPDGFQDITVLQPKTEGPLGAKIGWRSIDSAKGRGVFALENIPKGTVILCDPVAPVSTESIPDNGDAPDGYLLDWLPDTPGQEHALVLGYIILTNHSKNPNITIENDYEETCVRAYALRDIQAGEELTWDYDCHIWFEEEE